MKHHLLFALTALTALAVPAAAQTTTNRFAATIVRALTNDFAITNQTNMTVVSGLTTTVEPNRRYLFQFLPLVSASASSTELQIVASNATVYGFWDGITSLSYSTNSLTNVNGFNITTARAPYQVFYVVGGTNTNAGSISVQFRSGVATNTNTFNAGSMMRADKLPQ